MSALNSLLDKAIAKCEPKNDSALAKRLGLTRASVSRWRHDGAITLEHLSALINLAGEKPEIAILVMEEQATTPASRYVWGTLARRLATAAMLAVVAFGSIPIAKASIEQGIENPRVGGSIPSPATI
ncbi:DUF3693 domain-containing protein [Lysobacter capsici]|uniref:DUF3693 domain-containing protein n=1 Tax=Lysobacter capsici TaxID=435897 RepID=UPI001C003D1C|nr:DUF3693 domain-containing protein [Lysobacter capsici]QWF18587.1 hypothetical protein KME82_07525 [Lysobacter capsici]